SQPDSLRPAEKNVRSGERQYPSMNSSSLPAFQAATWASRVARISAAADFGRPVLPCFAACLERASCALTFATEPQRDRGTERRRDREKERQREGGKMRSHFFVPLSLCPSVPLSLRLCGKLGSGNKNFCLMLSLLQACIVLLVFQVFWYN